jgi:hypothetical protein
MKYPIAIRDGLLYLTLPIRLRFKLTANSCAFQALLGFHNGHIHDKRSCAALFSMRA